MAAALREVAVASDLPGQGAHAGGVEAVAGATGCHIGNLVAVGIGHIDGAACGQVCEGERGYQLSGHVAANRADGGTTCEAYGDGARPAIQHATCDFTIC